MAQEPVQAAPDRAPAHHGLPEDGRDEVPRQPDRLGRPAVPPRHDRDRSTRPRSSTCWPPRSSAGGPTDIPPRALPQVQTFNTLETEARRPLATPLVEIEDFVPPSAVRPRPADDGEPAALAAPDDALLLHPAERQAAGLLGHGRRPAVQDPPLHEHRGRRAAAAAVRAADRPGAARAGSRGRASTSAACSTTSTRRCRTTASA